MGGGGGVQGAKRGLIATFILEMARITALRGARRGGAGQGGAGNITLCLVTHPIFPSLKSSAVR